MPSFGEQFAAARQTNQAVRALEASVRAQIEQAFLDWESGILTNTSVRWKLEAIVRGAYRSAAAVGLAHISAQAGIPRWSPRSMKTETFRSAYLEGLLADVRRNLREYKVQQTPESRARAISRISHSAGVASSRGHTDAVIRSARELSENYGFVVRKVWRANFVNHTPCELCADLDGNEAELGAEFAGDNRLHIYGDLKGPPRHPRCMCWLVILIVGLENFDEDLDSDAPEQETMTTDAVREMEPSIFQSIVRWLRKLVRRLRSDDD